MSTHFTDLELRGVPIAAFVSDNGRFELHEVSGDGFKLLASGETLEAAKRTASAKLARRKVRVRVPFRTLRGGTAVATGYHATSGKVVTTNGEHQYPQTVVFPDDVPQDVLDRYAELHRQAHVTERAVRAIEREHTTTLRALVDAAISEATDGTEPATEAAA
jgi:hypothetical protein